MSRQVRRGRAEHAEHFFQAFFFGRAWLPDASGCLGQRWVGQVLQVPTSIGDPSGQNLPSIYFLLSFYLQKKWVTLCRRVPAAGARKEQGSKQSFLRKKVRRLRFASFSSGLGHFLAAVPEGARCTRSGEKGHPIRQFSRHAKPRSTRSGNKGLRSGKQINRKQKPTVSEFCIPNRQYFLPLSMCHQFAVVGLLRESLHHFPSRNGQIITMHFHIRRFVPLTSV